MYALVGVVVSAFLDSVPNKVCVGVGAQANRTSVPRVVGRERKTGNAFKGRLQRCNASMR